MGNWYQPQPRDVPKTVFDDIESIKAAVGRYFPIYKTEVHFDTVSMYCNVDKRILEQNFESLRKDLRPRYIPLITDERGEMVIHVVRNPPSKFKGPWLNLVLLVATVGTTIFAGASLWSGIFDSGSVFSAESLANGTLYFALPLMLIIGIHEMGHYFAARRHGVAASLPFFIPAPTLLGTLGALISIREPIPSKKALLDIGMAGPITGFIAAVPVLIIGLMLSGDISAPAGDGTLQGGTMLIGSSVLFQAFVSLSGLPDGSVIHPLAFAGWVGFLVTALNLLPVGQLDGGHVARALLGDRSKWAGYASIGAILVLGLFYSGWLFLALIVMFMGLRHPPPLNDVTQLTNGRKVVGVFAAAMLVLCFVPIPFSTVPVNYDFTFQEADSSPVGPYFGHTMERTTYDGWQNISFPFRIYNNGNMPLELEFEVSVQSNASGPHEFSAWLSETGDSNRTSISNMTLNIGQSLNLTLNMMSGPILNSTGVVIDLEEVGYSWESGLMTESGVPHGMRVRVNFS